MTVAPATDVLKGEGEGSAISQARIEIEMIRLLTLKADYLMDTVGNKEAQTEIAAIKVAAPNIAPKIVDRAIQVHGGAGVTDEFPLAMAWAHLRTLRMADGPDGVHKRAVRRYRSRGAGVTRAGSAKVIDFGRVQGQFRRHRDRAGFEGAELGE